MTTTMPGDLDTFPTHAAGQYITADDITQLGAALRAVEQILVGPIGLNVRGYGAQGDGTSDDTAALQSAISAAAQGGVVWLPPATYAVGGTVHVPSRVTLYGPGAILRRQGASTAPVLAVGSGTAAAVDAGIYGLEADGNGVAYNAIELHSVQRGTFIQVRARNAAGAGFALFADATAGGAPEFGIQNTVFNSFLNCYTNGCPTGLAQSGTGTQFVTNNFFHGMTLWNCTGVAIDLQQWCDSNHWYGTQIALVANNAVGVRFNSSTTVAQGVYNEQFYGIAIDINGTYTGCQALVFGYHAGNTGAIAVRDLFTSPQPWPASGTLITDTSATAWLVEARSETPQPGGAVITKGVPRQNLAGVGTSGGYQVISGGSPASTLLLGDVYPASPGAFAGLSLGAASPTTSSYALISDGTQLYVNVPSTTGDLNVRAGNTPIFTLSQHGHLLASYTVVPTAVAGANAGTGAPAPVITGANDRRGLVTFGTGTTPAAGAMVVITFASAYGAVPPTVHLTPRTAATAALGVAYATAVSATAFTIAVPVAPAAGQANTTYAYAYTVEG